MVSDQACPHASLTLNYSCHLPGLWASIGNHMGRGSFFHPCKIQVEKLKLTKLKSWELAIRIAAWRDSSVRWFCPTQGGSAPHQAAPPHTGWLRPTPGGSAPHQASPAPPHTGRLCPIPGGPLSLFQSHPELSKALPTLVPEPSSIWSQDASLLRDARSPSVPEVSVMMGQERVWISKTFHCSRHTSQLGSFD